MNQTTMLQASSIDELIAQLADVGYQAERRLATALFLSLKLQRPLLLEGEPGVGKTELAKALAQVLNKQLIRLQCYDGMEQREALYEWNYAAQLLHMRAAQDQSTSDAIEREVYQEKYLIRRPLLQALQAPAPGAVLLIDEVDRADEPFEAFLLEYLGEYQISIPELGTIKAQTTPVTILTSNRTRDLNDAIKRRCLYHWMEYPEHERELAIVRAKVPQASIDLAQQVATFVGRVRSQNNLHTFERSPAIAETVEWARALVALDTHSLNRQVIEDTAGILFKQREDVDAFIPLIEELLAPEAT